jgi:hypothetical protein
LNNILVNIRPEDPSVYLEDVQLSTDWTLSIKRLNVLSAPRLTDTLRLIDELKLTKDTEMLIEKISKLEKGRGKWSPIDYIKNMEIRRAVFSSTVWIDQMKKDCTSYLNIWGLVAGHTETCVLIPPKHDKTWNPRHVVEDMLANPELFKKQIGTNEVGRMIACVDYYNNRNSRYRAGMVFTRALAWIRWCEDNPSLTVAEKEAQLTFIPRHSRHSSHRCGQPTCIVHLIFESWMENKSRDFCKADAEGLRRSARRVPEFCSKHNPPCYMQLQALTASEAFNVQASIALRESKHWVDETDQFYPTRENSWPFEFVSRSYILDDSQQIQLYDGPTPMPPNPKPNPPPPPKHKIGPGDIQCPLCPMRYTFHGLKFLRHCQDKHAKDPAFFATIRTHLNKWIAKKRESQGDAAPEVCGILSLLRSPMTNEKISQALKLYLTLCSFCPRKENMPFAIGTWVHYVDKHYEEPDFLEVMVEKAKDWRIRTKKEKYNKKRADFLDILLADNITKTKVRDLIR